MACSSPAVFGQHLWVKMSFSKGGDEEGVLDSPFDSVQDMLSRA